MNSYYLTLVLRPDLEEKTRKEVLDSVTKKFAKILKEDLWGIRTLAYPIKRQISGYYAHFEIQSEPKDALNLDKSLDLEEDILRYLLIKR